MNIKVLCHTCSANFTVEQSRLGKTVACPRCMAPNEVLVAADAGDEEVSISDGEYRLADDGPQSAGPSLAADLLRDAENSESPPAAKSAPQAQATNESSTLVCQGCGADLPSGALKCETCGKPTKLQELASRDDPGALEVEREPGFRGWMSDQLSDGESMEGAMLWGQVAAAFVLFVITILNLPWFLYITIPLVVLFVVYKIVNHLRVRGGKEPLSWYLLLAFGRMTRWGFFKGPFAKRRVFSKKGKPFADADLETIENPESLDALDLQGTQITDNSLDYLARLKELRFLVIRNTNISQDGFEDLQERLRATWIWF